jgi:phosphoglycolate phosphatase-like HAD superfamily hydrolase
VAGFLVAPLQFLSRYTTLFWDFDGVIKESVAVKTEAFARLFNAFGAQIVARVRSHHEAHGGMSRFEKIPLYLSWAGADASAEEVRRYCDEFAATVRSAVVAADWVPGAREYLDANRSRQRFAIVTATPQAEIEDILAVLGIAGWFAAVQGAPLTKSDAVHELLRRFDCRRESVLMIGDSDSDHLAAAGAGIDFLLRRTILNRALQERFDGPQCESFLNE